MVHLLASLPDEIIAKCLSYFKQPFDFYLLFTVNKAIARRFSASSETNRLWTLLYPIFFVEKDQVGKKPTTLEAYSQQKKYHAWLENVSGYKYWFNMAVCENFSSKYREILRKLYDCSHGDLQPKADIYPRDHRPTHDIYADEQVMIAGRSLLQPLNYGEFLFPGIYSDSNRELTIRPGPGDRRSFYFEVTNCHVIHCLIVQGEVEILRRLKTIAPFHMSNYNPKKHGRRQCHIRFGERVPKENCFGELQELDESDYLLTKDVTYGELLTQLLLIMEGFYGERYGRPSLHYRQHLKIFKLFWNDEFATWNPNLKKKRKKRKKESNNSMLTADNNKSNQTKRETSGNSNPSSIYAAREEKKEEDEGEENIVPEKTGTGTADSIDPELEDLLDFSLKRKKKKASSKTKQSSTTTANTTSMKEESEQVKAVEYDPPTYSYQLLLHRLSADLVIHHPELVDKKRSAVKPPQVARCKCLSV